MGLDPREFLNDSEEAQRLALDGRQANIWTCMPAIVQSVDYTRMVLSAQIAIQGRAEDQTGNIQWQDISVIEDIPIVWPSAAGFIITFPIPKGSEVLLHFANRCIDSWWQNGGYKNIPLEFRMHDLSDGFAVPGPVSQPNVVPSISSTDLQIRNTAGTVYLSIGADGKIGFVNAATSLKTVLNDLNGAVKTFATSCASATTVAQIATAAGILVTSLTAVTTEIGALLK